MAQLKDVTPFFSLPLELREQIYKSVLASSDQGSELLRTCREVHAEAQKFIYQRNINFRDQVALFKWLDRVPLGFLPHVTEISISIADIDHSPLLKPDLRASRSVSPGKLLTTELYEAELERLQRALERIPKVKSLTIRALPGRQSLFYRKFLSKVLGMVSSPYPNLLEFRLEGNSHHQDLTFLSKLARLRSFSFDGFSSSSPAEVASILSNLEHLAHLSLVSQHALLTPERQVHSGLTMKQQSFTPEVMRTLSQLASFSVSEQVPSSSPTLFFTEEILGALDNHGTLKSLSISLWHKPDDAVLDSLRKYLERNSIERLELDWCDLDPAVLKRFDLLSGSVRHFWIRSRSTADAVDILRSVGESREAGDLAQLRSIVLVRSFYSRKNVRTMCDRQDSGCGAMEDGNENDNKYAACHDTDRDDIFRAKRRLQALGVRVSWCTESL